MTKVLLYLGMCRSESSFKHVQINGLVLLLYRLLCETEIDKNNFSVGVGDANGFSDLLVLFDHVGLGRSNHQVASGQVAMDQASFVETAKGAADSLQEVVYLVLFLAVRKTTLSVYPVQNSADCVAVYPLLSQPATLPVKS
jgi:hypothetical protein